MWLFTKVGFFSAVLKDKAEADKPLTEQVLMVRARVREDLDLLRKHYAPKLGPTLEWPGRDYPYRGLITRRDLAEAAAKAMLDIDYTNFKDKVAQTQGYDRAHLYGAVWGVMNGAEQKLGARVKKAGEKAKQSRLLIEDGVARWDKAK